MISKSELIYERQAADNAARAWKRAYRDLKMNTEQKLDEIIARLERIEQRQIKTTRMVEVVKESEQSQVVGSFGTSEIPEEK